MTRSVGRGLLVVALTVALLGGACGGASFERRVAMAPAATTTTAAVLDGQTDAAAAAGPAPASALPGIGSSRGGGGTVRAAPRGPGLTGRIEIPKIGLDHLTYEGNTLAQIDHGPSHWPGTPMPGHAGNTVFPGHRTTHSRPFYFINELVAGDQIIFTTNDGRFVYEVYEAFTVRPHEMWIVENTPNPIVTIFGCHPRGSAKFRYVVRGRLISAPAARPAPTSARPAQPSQPSQPSPSPTPPSTQPPPPSTTPTTKPCLICL